MEPDLVPAEFNTRALAAEFPRGSGKVLLPRVDIAVDPLEGTNLCALGMPGAISVLAASGPGGLLHAPDLFMEKLIVGPKSKNAVDLDAFLASPGVKERQAAAFALRKQGGIKGLFKFQSSSRYAGRIAGLAWLPPVGITGLKHRFRVPGAAGLKFRVVGVFTSLR